VTASARMAVLLFFGWLVLSPSWAQEQVLPAPGEVLTLPIAGSVDALKQQAVYLPIDQAPDTLDSLFFFEGFMPWQQRWEASAPPLWLRLHLNSPIDARNDWLLKIKRRYFPQLELLVLDPASGQMQRHSLGLDNYMPGEVSAQDYIIPLGLQAGQERIVLMRVETLQQSLSSLVMSLEDELTFKRNQNTQRWAFGLYFGSVIALLIYNLTLYLNLRSPGHRMYVIAISSVLLFMSMDSGLLQSWLPDVLRQKELSVYIAAAALMMATSMLFFQVFAQTRKLIPRLHRLIAVISSLLLILMAIVLVVPQAWTSWLAPGTQAVISLATLVLLGSSLYGAIKGSSASMVFFIAWLAFLLGSILRSLVAIEWLVRMPIAEYFVYIGSVMEAMILALGLSYRVGQLRMQRNRAEREQLKAMALANMDPLTGAYNRRFFDSYLAGILDPDEDQSPRGALILIDIDYFKETNDQFGHDAGDAVLQALVKRSQNELRATDVLCRLGGDEFAVILSSLEEESALEVAERLHRRVSRHPVMHQGNSISLSVSVGVLSPLSLGMDEAVAIRSADHALYAAKRAGRNQVKVYESPMPAI